ncbi:MAG: radical SAM protein [Chloroflexota bacterium]
MSSSFASPLVHFALLSEATDSDCACVENSHPFLRLDPADSDCACAHTPCPSISSTDLNGPWRTAKDVTRITLPGDWHGLFAPPGGSVSLAVLNQPAYDLWSRFQSSQTIDTLQLGKDETQALYKMAAAGLLREDSLTAIRHTCTCDGAQRRCKCSPLAIRNSVLASWLHLTDRCNLRCSYCYLPHASEDMTSATGRAAIDATFRSAVAHGYQRVKFKYAGGEPLLRSTLIKELHQYAHQLAKENELELDGVVLSNGTLLTQSLLSNLQSLDLRLMISLDGIGDWHNTQRPYVGDRGSFNDVAEAVELALDHDLVPDISITISGRNAEGLPEIIAWVLERDLPFSVNFYRQNDFSVTHEDLQLEEEKIIAGMMAAFEVVEANLPERSLLASLADRANLALPHTRTCSVGDSYLVFDQHGRVAKCQMQMDQPVTDIHAADPLALVREDTLGIQNISVEEKQGCRDCQWKLWCAGGCPLETHRATGRYDLKSPNCNIYKAIFPEVLRLEGLRLLKYATELEQAVA